ncbi:hypothetical protein [Thalassobius sp. Cn5-15]|uniref:hypothetical protein n=1 Tax=Thalassobius sp. Cn5-15 TaxID=2917763 RepID=UPI001EF23BA2|nr:hypothetical protein [Thalassobius sp. Cn5-15]MCG7492410.1 hypothetical protein [Thalassobius sp. Cn5-15]
MSSIEKTSIKELLAEMERRGYLCAPKDAVVRLEAGYEYCNCAKCSENFEKMHETRCVRTQNALARRSMDLMPVQLIDGTFEDGDEEVRPTVTYHAELTFICVPAAKPEKMN